MVMKLFGTPAAKEVINVLGEIPKSIFREFYFKTSKY